jgi:NADH dehydrogenase
MLKNKKKILIIGGGYAGLKAVEKLSSNANLEIILLDKNSYHYMQTDVYDLIANEEDFASVTVDLFTYCMGFENATFLKQEVKELDFSKKKVITDTQRFVYDYLIIAVGSRTKFAQNVSGLREYAYGIKALHRAMYFKQKFEMSLFRKVEESGTYCKPLSIVIAGAGLSGVEIAAQMASFSNNFYKKNHFICRKLNIILINSAKNILNGMDDRLVLTSAKRLKKLGVEIKNRTKVTAVTRESVTLSCGKIIPMDFLIFAGGIEPNGLIFTLDLEKNSKGYIVTNEYLQVKNYKDVFALGDATTLYTKEGRVVAPTADTAEQMAEICAKNIHNLLLNRPLKAQTIESRGIIIALGDGYAAAKVFGFYVNGYLAFMMKKIIEKLYAYNLDNYSKKGCHKIFKQE